MENALLRTDDGRSVEYPAPSSCIVTVAQLEERHPALKGRARALIFRADMGAADYADLRDSIIRLGRSVYIDEPRFLAALHKRAGAPSDRPRNPDGCKGKAPRATKRKRAAA